MKSLNQFRNFFGNLTDMPSRGKTGTLFAAVDTGDFYIYNTEGVPTIVGSISAAEVAKLALITITQAVDLDDVETNSNASKVITDFISVTQAVDLDDIETNSDASKVITDFITVTQAVDLDAIETNSEASKVITDFITVTQAVDLDAIETNSDASKVITDWLTVTQAVDLDTMETDVAANNAKVGLTAGSVGTTEAAARFKTIVTANVVTTYTIDRDAGVLFNLTMTGDTTFSDDNLASGISESIEIILDGNHVPTFPAEWEAIPNSEAYDGSVRNHIIASTLNGGSGTEVILYGITNLAT